MKIVLGVFFIMFILSGCYQLIPGDNIDIPEIDITAISIKPEESKKVEIYPGEINSLPIELTDIENDGIYAITFSPQSSYGDLNVEVYREEPFFGVGDYSLLSNRYTIDNTYYIEYLVEIPSGGDEVAVVSMEMGSYESAVFSLSFNYRHDRIIDPFLNYEDNRTLPVDTSLSGIFSRLIENSVDKFEITGLVPGNIYKLSIDYDFSQCLLNQYNNYPWFYDSNFKIFNRFNNDNRVVYFFSIIENSSPLVHIIGDIGTEYNILVTEELKTFGDDAYEPDGGPLSASLELLTPDTESDMHTFIDDDVDWFRFTPDQTGNYKVSLTLLGTYYDIDTEEEFYLYTNIDIIKPNGDEIEDSLQYGFTQTPELGPVVSTDNIIWEVEDLAQGDWYIRLSGNGSYYDYSNRFQYTILIEK